MTYEEVLKRQDYFILKSIENRKKYATQDEYENDAYGFTAEELQEISDLKTLANYLINQLLELGENIPLPRFIQGGVSDAT